MITSQMLALHARAKQGGALYHVKNRGLGRGCSIVDGVEFNWKGGGGYCVLKENFNTH